MQTGLRPGDDVRARREDGRTAAYRISRVTSYPKSRFPTRQVYGDLLHALLRLITGGGRRLRHAGYHRHVGHDWGTGSGVPPPSVQP